MRGHYRNAVRFKGSSSRGTFALEWHLFQYGERMLGRVEMGEPLLVFIMRLLPQRDRLAALHWMRRRTADKLQTTVLKLPDLRFSISIMDVDDFARELMECTRRCRNTRVTAELEAFLRERVIMARERLPKREQCSCSERIMDVKRVFGLADGDVSLLAVALCYSISGALEAFCDATDVQRKLELVSVMTGLPLGVLASAASRDGRLVRTGILAVPDPWSDGNFYTVTPRIRDHLIGMGSASLLHKFAAPTGKARYTPECFGIPEESVRIVMGLLRTLAPCNILIHGVPGTGKTEFAKAVAEACGKESCFVAHASETDLKSGRVAVEAVCAAHLAGKFVVVIDEADELLNLGDVVFGSAGGRPINSLAGKSWLNGFLDRSQAQIIWITNEIGSIDESSMRRFAYNVPFRRQSVRRRQEVWREHLRESPLLPLVTEQDVAEMARRFSVDAAGIANALMNTARIVPVGADQCVVLGTLREFLASHERLTGAGADDKLARLSSQYDPNAVCTDVAADGIVAGLSGCAAMWNRDVLVIQLACRHLQCN